MARAITIMLCLWANVVCAQGDSGVEPIVVNVAADRSRAYLNEQILLTLTVKVHEAAFGITGNQPSIANASIVSLHKHEYTENIAGEVYKTTQRIYAAFAEKTGKLSLSPITYRAQLPVSFKSSVEPAEDKNTDKPTSAKANPKVSATTPGLELTILPPASASAVWLPAAKLSITNSWLNTNNESSTTARAGEPLTLQVEIQIQGQHPAAVPSIELANTENLRVYSEQPELISDISPSGIAGSITQTLSVIGSHAGKIEFPGVQIDWWDINQQVWRTASTPVETLHILPALRDPQGLEYYRDKYWRTLLIVAGLVLALAVSLYFQPRKSGSRPPEVRSETAAWRNVMRRAKQRDPRSLRSALETWSAYRKRGLLRKPGVDLIEQQHADLEKIMALLDQHLYGDSHDAIEDWPGLQNSLGTIRRELKKNKVAIERSALANLYPDAQT